MTRKLLRFSGWLLGASLLWPASARAGDGDSDWWHVDNCAQIPCGALPAPPGTYVNHFIQVQTNLAEADDFVLYRHMWYRGGTELGPLGRYQLDLITRRLAKVPFPIVIETSKNDNLDEARRDVIVKLMTTRGLKDPTRIIVAYPIAEGLYADEAPRIYNGIIGLGNYGNNGYGGNGAFGNLGGFGGFGFGSGFGGFGGIGGFGY
jgi:hypothetical protein